MVIYLDADGCPVVDLTLKIAAQYGVSCVIVCDTSHVFSRENTQTIVVDKGADSVDFALVNRIRKGDLAVTQDYGLAAMCLAKGASAINQNGLHYTEENIGGLLETRHAAKKARMAGKHLKGPSKRTKQQDEAFERTLRVLLETKLMEKSSENG
ncbi:MAG: YaiI/YqxD family protein [Clostridia bacterium]|nr:YaiI/YqxD family protein [Clostridia bacterium]